MVSKSRSNLYVQSGKTQSLRITKHTTIEVKSGQVWITCDGEIEDFIVAPGQMVTIPKGKHAILQALSNAEVDIYDENSLPADGTGIKIKVKDEDEYPVIPSARAS